MQRMTTLARLNVVYSGWAGGPGINRLVFSPGVPAIQWNEEGVGDLLDDVLTCYNVLAPIFGNGVIIRPDDYVTLFDSESGQATGVVTSATGTDTIGPNSNQQGEATATMILARFKTDVWQNGRRIQGRSFLGPISGHQIDGGGKVQATALALIEEAYTGLTSGIGARLAVYSRGKGNPATMGTYGDVVSATGWSKAAVLRSRRD